MGKVDWAALKTSKWQQINGSDSTRHRTWGDTGIQILTPVADSITIPEEATLYQVSYVDQTELVSISEILAKIVGMNVTDLESITDTLSRESQKVKTDAIGVTDIADLLLTLGREGLDLVTVGDDLVFDHQWVTSETMSISDIVAKTVGNIREEFVDITDSISLGPQKVKTDSISITEALESLLTMRREGTDAIGIAEVTIFDNSWIVTDQIPVAEVVAKDSSWNFDESVTISESTIVRMELIEDHLEIVQINDELHLLVWDTSESGGMSLVDDVRVAVKTTLGLTDAQVAGLTINDLLHRYWSANFPLAHTYDGSESLFTPAVAHSILDHHSSVESREGTNLNWIRSVTAT